MIPVVNYERLVETYNSQLKLFAFSSSKFEEMGRLSTAVMSFSDWHLQFIGSDANETVLNANLYMLENFFQANIFGQQSNLNTLVDENYFLTSKCSSLIVQNQLEKFCLELIPEMNLNAYRIGRVYQKSRIRRGM